MVDVDTTDNEDLATIIISLMQKYTREKRVENFGQPCEEFIQFRLYKVLKEDHAANCARDNTKLSESDLERTGNSGNYINKREVTCRFRVSPGYYLIIPSYDFLFIVVTVTKFIFYYIFLSNQVCSSIMLRVNFFYAYSLKTQSKTTICIFCLKKKINLN